MNQKQVTFECTECGEPLYGFFQPDEFGNMKVWIKPCTTCTKKDETDE